MPLAATLKQAGLRFDAQAANAHIGRWLIEVANHRVHATTRERPDARMPTERAALMSLPAPSASSLPAVPTFERPVPVQSLQHPLSVYNALLEVRT